MAAVGLSWEEAKRRCPPDVFPACHNSADSVTISGPRNSIDDFIAELKAEGIFAKAIHSSGVAFHSKYIASAGPKLRDSLERFIVNPKPRTPRLLLRSNIVDITSSTTLPFPLAFKILSAPDLFCSQSITFAYACPRFQMDINVDSRIGLGYAPGAAQLTRVSREQPPVAGALPGGS
jgi:hypothetical protein